MRSVEHAYILPPAGQAVNSPRGLCYLKRSKMVILPNARNQLNQKNAIARRFAILTIVFIIFVLSRADWPPPVGRWVIIYYKGC